LCHYVCTFFVKLFLVYLTLTENKKMRFCPKCSLKIKANIEQCPICKVELLSCADDEDVTAHLSKKGEHTKKAVEESPAPSPLKAPPAQEPATPAQMKPDTAKNEVPPAEDLTILSRKLKSLEDHLVHIEKTIEINSSKDDIIRSSIVDLESKITKLEKTLADQEAVPPDRLKHIEAEIVRLSSSSTSIHQDEDTITTGSTPLASLPEMPAPSTESLPSPDFSSQDTGFSEEEITFAEDTQDDFEETFEPTIADKLADKLSPRERKRKLPIVLPLIALILIAAWLAFYYAKPRTEEMQEKVVAEKIVLPTTPKTTPVQPEKNTLPAPAADTVKSGEEQESALTPPVPAKQPPKTSQKTPAAAKTPLNGSGYTVRVGAFKDKALARSLTTQLREKGYSALMSPSKDKQFYRVKVGAFSTKKEALAYASVLEKKEKLPTFVTQINQP
jgi:cell division septation protein DedD